MVSLSFEPDIGRAATRVCRHFPKGYIMSLLRHFCNSYVCKNPNRQGVVRGAPELAFPKRKQKGGSECIVYEPMSAAHNVEIKSMLEKVVKLWQKPVENLPVGLRGPKYCKASRCERP